MLKKLAAAMLGAALIAGPAFAAKITAGSATPAAAAMAVAKPETKPNTTVRHVRRHLRRHLACHTVSKLNVGQPKSSKKHRHHLAAHVARPAGAAKPTHG